MAATIKDLVILYVEDDRFSRKVIEVLLTDVLPVRKLHLFENSENFMERLRGLPHKPSLIFLDIQMKPIDGYEALRLLRDSDDYKEITTIALTANVMAHDVDQLKKVGFDGLIGKPILEDVFAQLIQMIADGKPVWYIP